MAHSADYTGRWKVTYNSFKKKHSFVIRLPDNVGAPTSTHADSLTNAFSVLTEYLPNDFMFIGGEFAVGGSDDFLESVAPLTNQGNQEDFGYDIEAAGNLWEQAGELKFHWKAPGPSMTNFSVFGFHVDSFSALVGVKHKIAMASNVTMAGVRSQLVSIPVCAANGIAATMRSYVTYQYNSYWETH